MADEANGGKGKGKSASSTSQQNQDDKRSMGGGGTSSSAAQSLASALRGAVVSNQLSTLMAGASGGKAEFAPSGSSQGELRDWLVQDLKSSSSTAGSSSAVGGSIAGSGFRSAPSQGPQNAQDAQMFEQFESGMTLNDPARMHTSFNPIMDAAGSFEQAWKGSTANRWRDTGLDPSTAQHIESYTQLDGPLHASVRSDHSLASHSSTRSQPATAPLAQSDDIFALLDAEIHTSVHTSSSAAPANAELSSEVLSAFDPIYRAPSPSNSGFSRDQAHMHLQLAEAQASTQGQQKLVVPRPDNPELRQGVYAFTAEEALRAVFEGRDESTQVEESEEMHERGRAVVKKITRYFGGGSYLQDVYGLPPLLKQLVETVGKEDAHTDENRQKAIRRLESLWNHISNTPPQPNTTQSGNGWVDDWLQNNT